MGQVRPSPPLMARGWQGLGKMIEPRWLRSWGPCGTELGTMRHCPSQDPESGTPFRGLPFSGLGALSPHQLAGFGGSPSPKLPAGGSHPFIRSPGLGAPTPQISRTGELPLPNIGGYHRLFGGSHPLSHPGLGAPTS